MTEETKVLHVGLKYVEPEENRERFRALPEEVQASWTPTTGRQDKVGDPTEYTLEAPPEIAEELKRSAPETPNVAYFVEAIDAHPHADLDQDVWPMEEVAGPVSFPEPASLAYVGLSGVLDETAGKDVVFFHLDTGAADWQRAEYVPARSSQLTILAIEERADSLPAQSRVLLYQPQAGRGVLEASFL